LIGWLRCVGLKEEGRWKGRDGRGEWVRNRRGERKMREGSNKINRRV
jgi:hypothetical protein